MRGYRPRVPGLSLEGVPAADTAVAAVTEALAPLPARLAHSLGVGRAAERIAGALAVPRPDLLVAAAYLLEVGFADDAVGSGLHQLDGARHLRSRGADPDLCRIVAHHMFGRAEAAEHGVQEELLAEFPEPEGDLAHLVGLATYCDLTTSSRGRSVTVEERVAGILARYAPDHPAHRHMSTVLGPALALQREVAERLAAAGHELAPV